MKKHLSNKCDHNSTTKLVVKNQNFLNQSYYLTYLKT